MQSSSYRSRKAYSTTAVVILSYVRLWLAKQILGEKYYLRRIEKLHEHNAQRVKTVILDLSGLFVKVGQLLSILTNFLPEAFQKPLEELQDKIPARPYQQVKDRIFREFGKMPEDIFRSFDPVPIAAASIGQVHRAILPDGTSVAVKVQHADIEEIAQIDLKIIKRITKLISWFYEIKGMDYLYLQVRRMIEEELDFAREAASMKRIQEALAEEPGVAVPNVYPAFSTPRVLTTEWHEGVKIANTLQLERWGVDRKEMASTLLRAWCHMIFKDGFYHADPHPGNLLVKENGTLVILDFGATGEVNRSMREGIPKLIESAVKNDTGGMLDACRSMGFLADGREAEEIAEKMIQALRNFLQNEVELDGLNFKDIKVNPFNNSLVHLMQEIGISGITGSIQVPKDYVLLNRAMLLLLGLCNSLDPKLNPLVVIRPYAQKIMLSSQGDLMTIARNLLQGTVVNALALPDEMRQTLQKVRRGQTEMRMPDVRDGARLVYLASRQWMMLLIVAGSVLAAYYFKQGGMNTYLRYAQLSSAVSFLLFIKYWRTGNQIFRKMST